MRSLLGVANATQKYYDEVAAALRDMGSDFEILGTTEEATAPDLTAAQWAAVKSLSPEQLQSILGAK